MAALMGFIFCLLFCLLAYDLAMAIVAGVRRVRATIERWSNRT